MFSSSTIWLLQGKEQINGVLERVSSANMKTARNRGDVPAPHVPSHGEKSTDKTAGEIIFDVDSLSFVDDWVKGDGQDQTFEHQLESSSRTPSNQKQRLGVGAIPEKSKQKVWIKHIYSSLSSS